MCPHRTGISHCPESYETLRLRLHHLRCSRSPPVRPAHRRDPRVAMRCVWPRNCRALSGQRPKLIRRRVFLGRTRLRHRLRGLRCRRRAGRGLGRFPAAHSEARWTSVGYRVRRRSCPATPGRGIRLFWHRVERQHGPTGHPGRRAEHRYAGCFDAVLSIAVFEHISDFKEAFRTATALLKPDGILIFEVPVVQFAGDVWYRSSLEHLHYATGSSIEYLFREILHLPLTGSVIDVQGFGCTYIGLTSPDAETARRAGDEYRRLTTSDPALLHGNDARFRWHLDLMHSAHSRPEILALHRHLKPEDWTGPSLDRLFKLWTCREEKLKSIEAYLPEVERAKNWLEEQVQSWQQVAWQRQEALVAYEAGKAWLEEQVRNWQQVAGQRQETLVAYEAGKAWLEEQVRSWQQVAGQRQETLVAYEAGKAGLEEQVRSWQQVAGQRQEALVAYEAGKAWLEEQVRSWQQVAGQRQETLAAYEAGKAWLGGQGRHWQEGAGQRRGTLG